MQYKKYILCTKIFFNNIWPFLKCSPHVRDREQPNNLTQFCSFGEILANHLKHRLKKLLLFQSFSKFWRNFGPGPRIFKQGKFWTRALERTNSYIQNVSRAEWFHNTRVTSHIKQESTNHPNYKFYYYGFVDLWPKTGIEKPFLSLSR